MIYAILWVLSGLAYIPFIRWKRGWPTVWKQRHSLEDGWREVVLVEVPVCVIGGPLWWCGYLVWGDW